MLDPDVERLLAAISLHPPPPFEQLDVEAARHYYQQSCASFALPGLDVASVEDRTTAAGDAIRVYHPNGHGAGPASASLPWLLYLHGGGWVLGDLHTHDSICRIMARESGACVIALDYPRAPEHPYPAALHSAYGAISWIRAHAAELRIDPHRMSIGGDSAGGALAASCCLMLRENGLEPPRMQVLFYPATDLRASSASYARFTSGLPLTASRMHWFLRHYLRHTADALQWRASPLLAGSLARLPPAFVVTAGHDPLRDEGIAYAQRLEQEGVRVTLLHLGDQIHGFLTLGRVLRRALPVLEQAARELRFIQN